MFSKVFLIGIFPTASNSVFIRQIEVLKRIFTFTSATLHLPPVNLTLQPALKNMTTPLRTPSTAPSLPVGAKISSAPSMKTAVANGATTRAPAAEEVNLYKVALKVGPKFFASNPKSKEQLNEFLKKSPLTKNLLEWQQRVVRKKVLASNAKYVYGKVHENEDAEESGDDEVVPAKTAKKNATSSKKSPLKVEKKSGSKRVKPATPNAAVESVTKTAGKTTTTLSATKTLSAPPTAAALTSQQLVEVARRLAKIYVRRGELETVDVFLRSVFAKQPELGKQARLLTALVRRLVLKAEKEGEHTSFLSFACVCV